MSSHLDSLDDMIAQAVKDFGNIPLILAISKVDASTLPGFNDHMATKHPTIFVLKDNSIKPGKVIVMPRHIKTTKKQTKWQKIKTSLKGILSSTRPGR